MTRVGTQNGETESSQDTFAGALMPEILTSKTLTNALLLIIDHLEDGRFFLRFPDGLRLSHTGK